jgi:hypothetical protein
MAPGDSTSRRSAELDQLRECRGTGHAWPGAGCTHDERTYALGKSNPAVPVLTLTVNRDPQAFAAGVSDLQVRYVLNQGCPACTTVDLPTGAAQWQLVNAVVLTATVQTVGGVRPEDAATLVASSTAKPRNLLPP